MNAIQKFFFAILCIILAVAVLIVMTAFRPALATTTIDQCEDKGGIWQTYPSPHCAPPDMTAEQLESAKRYVTLKQIEMREVKK